MAKKKRYMIVPRTEEAKAKGLSTGKGKLTFSGKTATWVDDPAIAAEINTQHGLKGSGDVWVAQDENLEWHEKHDGLTDGKMKGIHNYTFQGIDMKGIRTTKDNGWVWVWNNGRQMRVKRIEAENEGYEIVTPKVRKPVKVMEKV
jgi:hypothetical protein